MTVLYSISALAPSMSEDILVGTMIPVALQMASDPVANVRLVAAQTLRQTIALLDPAVVLDRVKPCLSGMTSDNDQDVRYFASQALQAIRS